MNESIGNIGDMGGMIAKLLEDPESLSRVMSIAGTLSSSGLLNGLSLGEKSGQNTEQSFEETSAQSNRSYSAQENEKPSNMMHEKTREESIKTYSPQRREDKNESQNENSQKKQTCTQRPVYRKVRTCDRIRLLEAMRPFLSEEKCDKLNVVIKIIGLADAAGGLYTRK